MAMGLLLLVTAFAGRYYSDERILEKSQAKATTALRDITNETLLELTKLEMTADALAHEIEQHLNNADTMFVLSREILKKNKAIKGSSISFEPYFFKQKGRYFSAYSNDVEGKIITEQEGDDDYQYFYMDWYLIAKELNKKYWIEPYEEVIDNSTGVKEVMTSYSQPLHNEEDSVVGVLSIDIPLKWLSDIILNEHPLPQSYCMLLGRGGTYIVHPDRERLINETILTPTLEGKYPDLMRLGRAMISGETGVKTLEMNGVKNHVFYMPFGRIGWSLALVCPDEAMMMEYYVLSRILTAMMTVAILLMLVTLFFWLKRRKTLVTVLLTMAVATPLLLTSCGRQLQKEQVMTEADSLINEAYKMHDYERLLSLTELHQSRNALSEMKYYYWRGYAFSRMRQMRLAEIEWKKATTLKVENAEDLDYYAQSANRLAGVLYQKSNYEQAIRTATTAIDLLKKQEYDKNPDYANIQTFLGCCQMKLGRMEEATKNFAEAWQIYQQTQDNTVAISDFTASIIGIVTITDAYIDTGYYQEGLYWLDRFDNMLTHYRQHPMYDDDFFDKESTRLLLYKATALEGLNRKAEAEKTYRTALTTHYAKTNDGQIEATTYLIKAKRWQEAADKFQVLESQMRRYDMKKTLDNIQQYLQPKFLANAAANRKDSALATANEICIALDSALLWERQNSAMELATIYDTQQKETEIMEKETKLSQQRYLTIVVSLALLLLVLGLFTYVRYQAAKRLRMAYHELEKANERAEESSHMKSAFIQQISHEIRTPLNILSGFTQIITDQNHQLGDEERAVINQQIMENTNRITELINKMLELSDVKSQTNIERNDNISAMEIVADAIATSAINEAQHLTFDLQISAEAETIRLQTNHVAAVRALSQLLDNAKKFAVPIRKNTPKEKEATEKKQTVRLNVYKDGQLMTFCVEDTGIGIPTEEAEHIFEEFVQLDEFYDGTGIGLTVARSMARRLGGNIVLDTKYTHGARFILTLPC